MKKLLAAAAVVLLAVGCVFIIGFERIGEHYDSTSAVSSDKSVTLSISCTELLSNEQVSSALRSSGVIPPDGIIVPETTVPLNDGDTAFDILKSELTCRRIHFDYTSISDKSAYVKGINNIYEYDCGDLSGWMYSVNGVFPTVSSSEYVLNDGDVIEWVYTCDLGRDVGDTYYTMIESGDHEN